MGGRADSGVSCAVGHNASAVPAALFSRLCYHSVRPLILLLCAPHSFELTATLRLMNAHGRLRLASVHTYNISLKTFAGFDTPYRPSRFIHTTHTTPLVAQLHSRYRSLSLFLFFSQQNVCNPWLALLCI